MSALPTNTTNRAPRNLSEGLGTIKSTIWSSRDSPSTAFAGICSALKTFGVLLALASFAGAGWSTYIGWSAAAPPAAAIVAGLITTGLLLVWMSWVTERTVKLAANRYARFIIEAAFDQE